MQRGLCVIILEYTFLHFGILFFIGLYLFNTATDHVHFWHACTLGPGLYSPNVFGDAALINYANLCKICQSINILVYTFLHFDINFFTFWYTLYFISLYLFNTATDRVYFWHACTLGSGLYSPNVFGDAALINYANLCKICQSVNILVYTFLHFGIHFFIGLYLFNTATDRVYFWHAWSFGPGLYSPNVFGDAALINHANLCKFSPNHIKCSYMYFLISWQILFKFGIQIYYRFTKSPSVIGDAALIN